MKSAIFSESERPQKPRAFRKTISHKKAKSSSPFPPSSAPGSPATTSLAAVPKSSPWNAEDMISSYIASGTLPQLLSPTLPPQFARPGGANSSSKEEKDDHDPYEHDEDMARSPHASDIDNFPISLLSPTLPTMFEPKTDGGSDSSGSKASKKAPSGPKGRVRWANKLSDPKKPRLVVRITLSPSKLKSVHPSKQGLKGLGIVEIEPKHAVSPSPSKKTPSAPWRKIARSTMAHADRISAKDPLFSLVVQIDYILCLAIASDYDEKADPTDPQHVKSAYRTLSDEIPSFVARIDKYIKAHNIQDKKRAYLSFLSGVLTNLKALIGKRVVESLKSSLAAGSADSKDDTIHLQSQIINHHQTLIDTLAEAQSFFMLCPSPSTVFPKSWHNRSVPVQKPNFKLPLNPSTDKYYAPLGSYSDLRDACGYLFCCLREFMELYGSEMNDGVKYTFQSSKKL